MKLRKILIVHNRYQERGGEDAVVENEMALLKSHGHDVRLFEKSNDAIQGLFPKIATAMTTHYSISSKKQFQHTIDEFKPDLVHAHNLFPLITPSVLEVCKEKGIPSVLTVHNFRMSCANAQFFRSGRVCEKCLGHSTWSAVLHRCYRGSVLGSATVAHSIRHHRKKDTWNQNVSRLIALTEFSKKKLIQAGVHEEKISVKPNFLPNAPKTTPSQEPKNGFVFVGRLTEEKGIRWLVNHWAESEPLTIIGDGPLRKQLEKNNNVKCVGFKSKDEIEALLLKSRALIFPSLWHEGFPMVLLEAMRLGVPIVAASVGGVPEILGDSGFLFNPGDVVSFSHALTELEQNSRNGKSRFESLYSAKTNYAALLGIYQNA